VVIEAALRLALETGNPALIEATCNQVNQDGGYTGMTPAGFRDFVFAIAEKVGLPADQIILGGDHLGPNPWKHLPADQAMTKAETMIAAFSTAGFTKLHLDTSMGCAGEPAALPDDLTAARAARLASAAETHQGTVAPVYVIGTEVPVPGGAVEALDHMQITRPDAVTRTWAVHKAAFDASGQQDALARVIALVVQPGVEFGHAEVIHYDPAKTRDLSDTLGNLPGVVFEAHSTDYQTPAGLSDLVRDGFAILKVGPWLTFALREALYALDGLGDALTGSAPRGELMTAMETLMTERPEHWNKYYEGTERELFLQRHFSYSDRIRYYWPDPVAVAAVKASLAKLDNSSIPASTLHQYLPQLTVAAPISAHELLVAAVTDVLRLYAAACG
jgi:D-tagatose-1,6-bisphosphate aldolase subunit GatZ/KbaZ